jgi:hypothetical protein
MKKNVRRLALSRETLLSLEAARLPDAAGGFSLHCPPTVTCADTCPMSCYGTCPIRTCN